MPNELIKRRFLPVGATAAGKRRINHRFVSADQLFNDWNDARQGCAALWPLVARARGARTVRLAERVQTVAIMVLHSHQNQQSNIQLADRF